MDSFHGNMPSSPSREARSTHYPPSPSSSSFPFVMLLFFVLFLLILIRFIPLLILILICYSYLTGSSWDSGISAKRDRASSGVSQHPIEKAKDVRKLPL